MNANRYYVYIMSSFTRTLYVGMTNNLSRRVWEHKNKLVPGFTEKYNITSLVYAEECTEVLDAIAREKQIKKWRREKKVTLIESINPQWQELMP